MQNQTQRFGKSLPKPCLKWWLHTRDVKGQIAAPGVDLPPCIEFYVPWWAWPLELAHRMIFGREKIQGDHQPLKVTND